MYPTSQQISTRTDSYPRITHDNQPLALPIHPDVFEELLTEYQATTTDPNSRISQSYLEELVAEHQVDCVHGHRILQFIDHIETETDGFVAGYTNQYVYLIVERDTVWTGEAQWMNWNTQEKQLLIDTYTREVTEVGRQLTADWVLNGLDMATQAGYIVPSEFPFRSVAEADHLDTAPLELARKTTRLTEATVLSPGVAECLVVADALDTDTVNDPMRQVAEILQVGVTEVEAAFREVPVTQKEAERTVEIVSEYESDLTDVFQAIPESF